MQVYDTTHECRCVACLLPSGALGMFHKTQQDTNLQADEIVLDELVTSYDTEREEFEDDVQRIMDSLLHRIQLRTAFKKLYFRSYRLAWKPQGTAAERHISEHIKRYGVNTAACLQRFLE